MESDADRTLHAAKRAQEDMQDYLHLIVAGSVKPNKRKTRKLVRNAEETFKVWMATCNEFTVQ